MGNKLTALFIAALSTPAIAAADINEANHAQPHFQGGPFDISSYISQTSPIKTSSLNHAVREIPGGAFDLTGYLNQTAPPQQTTAHNEAKAAPSTLAKHYNLNRLFMSGSNQADI
ncbi:hypothetical protein ACFVYJ_02060 [Pontibacter sp. JAM-7]|uniref:hypothetical protein n=1 Tax=Pontibacter sp. JAM-7 TaxID=3366581 RepID=UPI003AF5E50C